MDGISILRFSIGWRPAGEISKLKKEGPGDIWLQTDRFCCWMDPLFSLSHFSSQGEPKGARLRWKFKIASNTYRPLYSCNRKSCLRVGSNRDGILMSSEVFSHISATQFRAESRRPGSKSILIGAPFPYAERSRAGFYGELTVESIVLTAALVPRTG